MRSTAVSTSLSSCRCSSSSPRPCTSASAAAMRSAMEATASATGCSRSEAYSDTISSSKVAKPGWSATLKASAAMPPRRVSSICTSRGSMPAAASAGRSRSSRGPGSASRAPASESSGADQHVAADAAGSSPGTGSSPSLYRVVRSDRTLPGPARPDTGCAPPSARPRGCMSLSTPSRPVQCRHAHRPARTSRGSPSRPRATAARSGSCSSSATGSSPTATTCACTPPATRTPRPSSAPSSPRRCPTGSA